jgi:hypothetical protein
MNLLTYLLILVFFMGLYFYMKASDKNFAEGFTNNTIKRCPNLLIQKDNKFYLYNSKVAKVPGVNPVEFDNLEDYTEFLDWQRSQGIRCPVLYLQQTYDAQGNPVYKVRPSVSEPQGGLPPSIASSSGDIIYDDPLMTDDISQKLLYPNPTLLVDATRNDPPYNTNSYPAYDESSYYIGTTTPLDVMNIKQEELLKSPDPMDPNWGGAAYTQSLVDAGYYKDDEVEIYIP